MQGLGQASADDDARGVAPARRFLPRSAQAPEGTWRSPRVSVRFLLKFGEHLPLYNRHVTARNYIHTGSIRRDLDHDVPGRREPVATRDIRPFTSQSGRALLA